MNVSKALLRFEPDSRRWFFQSDEGVWALDTLRDAMALASYLEVLVEISSNRSPLSGKASLRPGATTDHEIVLKRLQGGAEETALPLWPVSVSTATAEWSFGLHGDNWLECESEVILSDTRKAGFCFYLPIRSGMLEKHVAFLVDGQKISELELCRGKLLEHWVDIPSEAQVHCRLALQSSYEEPILLSEDDRSLGVIVVRMNLDNTTWKDVGAA